MLLVVTGFSLGLMLNTSNLSGSRPLLKMMEVIQEKNRMDTSDVSMMVVRKGKYWVIFPSIFSRKPGNWMTAGKLTRGSPLMILMMIPIRKPRMAP